MNENTGCTPDSCTAHGECVMTDDGPHCLCERGYSGATCEACATGYQDNDGDDICRPNCTTAVLDCDHGHCDDTTGTARCICDGAYGGDHCTQCATGYQDTDGDHICKPSCALLGYRCQPHGHCDDSTGVAVCICAAGYRDDGRGGCVRDGDGTSCQTPTALDAFPVQLTASTVGLADRYEGGCVADTQGNERIYALFVEHSVPVEIQTEGYDTVVYLRRGCTAAAPELACDDDSGPGRGSRIYRRLAPGLYYLFVDSYDEPGEFTLQVRVDCGTGRRYDAAATTCIDDPCIPNPCTAANRHLCRVEPSGARCDCDPGFVEIEGGCAPDPTADGTGCTDPIALTGPHGTVTGDTLNGAAAEVGSCGGDGPEHVYAFYLNERSFVEFDLFGYDTVLHLRKQCSALASERVCNDDAGAQHGSHLRLFLEPGSYFVFADSYETGGSYTLHYALRSDPCHDPQNACPGALSCESLHDWSGHRCVCPPGDLIFGDSCIADPCQSATCTDPHRHRCVADPPFAYHCACDRGFIPDPGDPQTCVIDPDAAAWTVLVYLDADNNLEDYGLEDLVEMEAVGSTDTVNIVVLLDSFAHQGGHAQLIEVHDGTHTVVEDWGETDMSDARTLRDFAQWGLAAYPAAHYALILWDHGNGWKSAAHSASGGIPKGFASDDHGSPGSLSIAQGDYARALSAIAADRGGPLDLIGFDACLMAMWEVAHATAPYARILVASQQTIPGTGWPYDDLLAALVADPGQTPAALGQAIADTYHQESSSNSTLSVVDLERLPALSATVSQFGTALAAADDLFLQIESFRASAAYFSSGSRRDLWGFAAQVEADHSVPLSLRNTATALLDALSAAVIYNRVQADHNDAHGLSIYFPALGTSRDSDYLESGATWSAETEWDEFIWNYQL